MARISMMFFILIMVSACGGGSSTGAEEDANSLTPEQETVLADSVATAYDSVKIEIKSTTEETLNEVDSLLNSIE